MQPPLCTPRATRSGSHPICRPASSLFPFRPLASSQNRQAASACRRRLDMPARERPGPGSSTHCAFCLSETPRPWTEAARPHELNPRKPALPGAWSLKQKTGVVFAPFASRRCSRCCIPPQRLAHLAPLALPLLTRSTCIVSLCFCPVSSSCKFSVHSFGLTCSNTCLRDLPCSIAQSSPVSFVAYSVSVAPPLYPIPPVDSHHQEPSDLSCMHVADSEVTRARNAG
jgi:hypothetical protein